MKDKLNKLLDDILKNAKKKGLDQKKISQVTQISESTISRAKKNKDIKFSTLEALANSVGMTITLSPDNDLVQDILEGNLFDD